MYVIILVEFRLQRESIRSIFEIVGEHDFIIKNIHGIYKDINNPPAVHRIGETTVLELHDPPQDIIF